MPTPHPWRLLDTGVRTGAENVALDQTLLTERSRGRSPNTLRFLQFSPPVALVGFHQRVDQEIRVDYCLEHDIGINRRLTGGGALLFDEPQLGWELIAKRDAFPFNPFAPAAQRELCQGAVEGLRLLGLDAQFRPRNDIEVNGRKLSGTGGVGEGDAFLFQGTLLMDFDIGGMLRALRVPTEKLKQVELDSAADRVTWIDRELGYLPRLEDVKAALVGGFRSALGVEFERGELTADEEATFDELLPQFAGNEWIHGRRPPASRVGFFRGFHRTEGACLVVDARIDLERKRLCDCLFTGDFFVHPQRFVYDVESALRDAKLDWADLSRRVRRLWDDVQPETSGFVADDLLVALRSALDRTQFIELGMTADEAASLFPVCGTPKEILGVPPSLLLLPYCAKLPECEHRHTTECPRCGDCTVGEAHLLADEAGLQSLTVTSFEHLLEALRHARQRGVKAFLGCCCEAFVRKHCDDFASAGLPGILVDICDTTCYELNQRHEAYHGMFENQTRLNLELLAKLLQAGVYGHAASRSAAESAECPTPPRESNHQR
jgi:lipoate-protein ligase A